MTRNLEEAVEISISDNGGGISSEIRPQIFDPFFSKKDSGKGTGLGLFFVHEIIVGEHQGKIEVQSYESQGTRFIIVSLVIYEQLQKLWNSQRLQDEHTPSQAIQTARQLALPLLADWIEKAPDD